MDHDHDQHDQPVSLTPKMARQLQNNATFERLYGANWYMLTPQQMRFVEAYLECWNTRRASIAAGYSADTGSSLLTQPDVEAAIAHRLTTLGVSPARVIAQLRDIADGDITDFLDERGNIQLVDPSTGDIKPKTHLIKKYSRSVDPSGTITTRIELYDKLDALGKLARAIIGDKQVHTGGIGVMHITPDIMQEALRGLQGYEQSQHDHIDVTPPQGIAQSSTQPLDAGGDNTA